MAINKISIKLSKNHLLFSSCESLADKTTHYSKNIGHLETGTYFLEIKTGDLVVQRKIVKI
ncbi:MAG: hypothetical protein KDC80_11840 [Saprospiraceae bacterium]|nr:hypothetical protein [Saprospiraceae bacterium]